jgi:hypothetical protein
MGTARFYWYPSTSGGLETVDLLEGHTQIDVVPERLSAQPDGIAGDAAQYREGATERLRVSLLLENMAGGEDLALSLESMYSHLARNGAVAFAGDHDKAVAAFVRPGLQRGDVRIRTRGNPWAAFNPSAALAVDDIVCIQTPNLDNTREWVKITSWGSVRDFQVRSPQGVRHDFDGSVILVRHKWFFPVLRLPADMLGRSLVTNQTEISFTLDADFVEDPAGWAAFVNEDADTPLRDDTYARPGEGVGGLTLDSFLAGFRGTQDQLFTQRTRRGLPF